MQRMGTRIKIGAFCLVLFATHCKSWSKFWDSGSSVTPFVLADIVNFSSVNFQASIYSGNNLWNDYVKNDGSPVSVTLVSSPFMAGASATGQSTRLSATGTACSPLQTGGYGTCIHAGMMRSFTISGLTSCAGLVVDDSQSAFHWVCEKRSSDLRVTSAGFKEGKYLTDLMDFTNIRFKAMSVTISYQGQSVTSTPSIWWLNTVQNLPGTSYGVASGIYLVQTNPASASTIAPLADKTALLVKPGVKITTTSGAALLNNSSRNFTWYEGLVDLNAAPGTCIGFAMGTGAYVVLQNFSIVNASATASSAFQIGGKNAYLRDVRYANATIASEKSFDFIAGSDNNLINGLQATNDDTSLVFNGSNNSLVNVTTAGSGNFSQFAANGQYNLLMNYTLANTNSGGSGAIRMTASGAQFNTLVNLATTNNPSPSIHFFVSNTYSQLINFATYVSTGTVFNATVSSFVYLGGIAAMGNSGALTCGTAGNSGFTGGCLPQDSSDFTVVNVTLDPANSFQAKVVTDDLQNTSDSSGTATYAISLDWNSFANKYRGYGLENVAAFPSVPHQGRCSAGTCRIWDWTLRNTDTQYRNLLTVPTGSMTAGHLWSAATQVNCTQPGATWFSIGVCNRPPFPGTAISCTNAGGTLTQPGCFSTFLRNAYEIIDDGIGNENGLCESNEACIYTPNIASYQGHGNLTCVRGPADLGCTTTFTNGTISNVVLYQYATNGY